MSDMFGDPTNAPVWSKAAVLLGSLTATVPVANAAFTLNDPTADPIVTTQWDAAGVLDSDTPFDDGAEQVTSQDHSGFGFGVYATTYTDQKETRVFTAKETTLVTLGLLYDTDGVTDTSGTLAGTLKQRDPTKKFKVAFHRQNGTEMERWISKSGAYIDSISRSFGNGESMRAVTVVIPPTSAHELYAYYKGPLL